MGIDLHRIEAGETIPGFHEGIYNRTPSARDIIARQVDVELKKLESTRYGEVQAVKNKVGDEAFYERARQQLAVQYEVSPHVLKRWEHEQGNVQDVGRRGAALSF